MSVMLSEWRRGVQLTSLTLGVGLGPALSLPIAGIDEEAAQSILFSIQQSVASTQDDAAACWLTALQLVQTLQDRLLHDLDLVDRDLGFWTRQLAAGRHGLFMLLGRGPQAFLRDLLHLCALALASLQLHTTHTHPPWGTTTDPVMMGGHSQGGGVEAKGGRG
ncbi:hypothetical protein QJQ45_022396, partial [Haematococcus lacustris]